MAEEVLPADITGATSTGMLPAGSTAKFTITVPPGYN